MTDADATIAEHSAARDAIAAGDPRGAEAAMRRHLAGVRARALGELSDG